MFSEVLGETTAGIDGVKITVEVDTESSRAEPIYYKANPQKTLI